MRGTGGEEDEQDEQEEDNDDSGAPEEEVENNAEGERGKSRLAQPWQQFSSGKRNEISRRAGQGEGGAGRRRRKERLIPEPRSTATWRTSAISPAPPRAKRTLVLAPRMPRGAAPSKPKQPCLSHMGHASAKT